MIACGGLFSPSSSEKPIHLRYGFEYPPQSFFRVFSRLPRRSPAAAGRTRVFSGCSPTL